MKVKSAALVFNPKKHAARATARQVRNFLEKNKIKINQKNPQIVITIGGDGTILFAKKYYGIPFFSIGSQTSFICQATFADWKAKLKRVLLKPKLSKRILLEAKIAKYRLPLALNEVGARSSKPQLLQLQLFVGKRKYAFRADGVIFSTPTGSSAYCYSCGGKEMPKESSKYQIVAICPFRRSFKPIILSLPCRLHLAGMQKADVFVDGKVFSKLSQSDFLQVKISKKKFLFLEP
ncbi:MAG: hypothetical protein N3G80_04350 [Candidatus Micrarchaeota archaeon]|nr:hypothetical protein [Candidatus Micrarchaeota archaeon]